MNWPPQRDSKSVPNRFGEMRDLAFFVEIFGIRAENRGGKRESQIRAGPGFRVFMRLECRICKRKRAEHGILILT